MHVIFESPGDVFTCLPSLRVFRCVFIELVGIWDILMCGLVRSVWIFGANRKS